VTKEELVELVTELAEAVALAEGVPTWVVRGAAGLVKAAIGLVGAKTSSDQESALFEAAEATKAALDEKKFGAS
jgi:hypothetical protein